MTDYDREKILACAEKLRNLASQFSEYSHLDIFTPEQKKDFSDKSEKAYFCSTAVGRIATEQDVARVNVFAEQIAEFDSELQTKISELNQLEIKIQEIGAIVGIAAELTQIALKIAKYAAA